MKFRFLSCYFVFLNRINCGEKLIIPDIKFCKFLNRAKTPSGYREFLTKDMDIYYNFQSEMPFYLETHVCNVFAPCYSQGKVNGLLSCRVDRSFFIPVLAKTICTKSSLSTDTAFLLCFTYAKFKSAKMREFFQKLSIRSLLLCYGYPLFVKVI